MSNEEFQKLVLAEFSTLHQEIEATRQEMRERFDRLEEHAEENVVATLNLIHKKVSETQEVVRSVTEVLGDHEVRIRTLTRRPV